MSIVEWLLWVASGLGSSAVFSYIAERWDWFQTLKSDTKRLVATVGASVLALTAYAVVTFTPAEFWVLLTPYWQIVVGVIAVNYGTQMFHNYDKELPSAQ